MIGYPYTYGDSRKDGCISSIIEGVKFSKFLAIITIVAVPVCANASENRSLHVLLAEAATPKNATKAIGPISAICCLGAGYCARIAQTTYRSGDVKASTAAACGAISLCCAQRVAQAYQL